MQVDSRKIQIIKANVEVLADGSVRYVFYKKHDEVKELVELKKSWSSSYTLSVNLPRERQVDTIIVVTRSSVNCYRVIISTTKGTELVNCKNYDEVNQAITNSLPK